MSGLAEHHGPWCVQQASSDLQDALLASGYQVARLNTYNTVGGGPLIPVSMDSRAVRMPAANKTLPTWHESYKVAVLLLGAANRGILPRHQHT